MTRDTNDEPTAPPTRTAVLDSIDNQPNTINAPTDDGASSDDRTAAGRARSGGLARRGFLAAAGAAGLTALSGCINPFSGPLEFDAEPAVLPLSPLEKRRGNLLWRRLNRLHSVVASGELSRGGLSKEVEIATAGATYRSVASRELVERLGGVTGRSPDGEPVVGETALLNVPKIEIGNRTVDLVEDLEAKDLVGRLSRTDARVAAEGRVVKRFELNDTVDDAAAQLQNAYNGELTGIEDVSFQDWGADSLKGNGPLVFTARAETRGGYRGPIAGTLEHLEHGSGHVYKASWTPTKGAEDFARHLRETGGRIADRKLFPRGNIERGTIKQSGDTWKLGAIRVCTIDPDDDHTGHASYGGWMNACHELRNYPKRWCQLEFIAKMNNWTHEEAERKCDAVWVLRDLTLDPGDIGTLHTVTTPGNGCTTNPPYCYIEDQIYL